MLLLYLQSKLTSTTSKDWNVDNPESGQTETPINGNVDILKPQHIKTTYNDNCCEIMCLCLRVRVCVCRYHANASHSNSTVHMHTQQFKNIIINAAAETDVRLYELWWINHDKVFVRCHCMCRVQWDLKLGDENTHQFTTKLICWAPYSRTNQLTTSYFNQPSVMIKRKMYTH